MSAIAEWGIGSVPTLTILLAVASFTVGQGLFARDGSDLTQNGTGRLRATR